jgi:hypothetical protein
MWVGAISLLVLILLIVHCIKTGRSTIWIFVMVLVPFAGVLAYIAVEILPGLFQGRTARRAGRNMKRVLDPHADLRRYESEARVGGNVASLQRYADELTRQGRYDEALEQYRKALTGLYEHDPNIMLSIAQAQFGKGDASAARQTLDDLIRLNPDFRSPQGHLLYARALEEEGDTARALDEYKVLASSYPGAEGGARYAQLLKSQGRADEARKIAEEIVEAARIAPAHYRRAQREWLDIAERIAGG